MTLQERRRRESGGAASGRVAIPQALFAAAAAPT